MGPWRAPWISYPVAAGGVSWGLFATLKNGCGCTLL
jgi:hypothetical protein